MKNESIRGFFGLAFKNDVSALVLRTDTPPALEFSVVWVLDVVVGTVICASFGTTAKFSLRCVPFAENSRGDENSAPHSARQRTDEDHRHAWSEQE